MPAAASSLPKTRIRASRIGVPNGLWSEPTLTPSSHRRCAGTCTTSAAGSARYTQPDPMGIGGGATWGVNQLYGYAADNPTLNTDPFGLYKVEPPSGTQSEEINQAIFQVWQKLNSPSACCGPLANKVMKVLSDPKLTFRVAPWLLGCGFSPGSVVPGINTIYIGTKAWGAGCCYGGVAGLNGLASTILHELVHVATKDASEPLPTWAESKCFGCKTPPPPPPSQVPPWAGMPGW